MSPYCKLVVLCCLLPLQILAAKAPPIEKIAEKNVIFSKDLFKAVSGMEGNLVMSPLSAQLVLAMAQLGARKKTLKEMSKALHLPKNNKNLKNGISNLMKQLKTQNKEGFVLEFANRIYVQKSFSVDPAFMTAVSKSFESTPQSVDFTSPATTQSINSWVEETTHDKIKNLIAEGSLNSDTRVVLVNAVYFNGRWSSTFDADHSEMNDFYTGLNTKESTMFMRKDENYKYANITELDAQLIELEYEGGKGSMLILMPNSRTGLPALERKMKTQDLNSLVTSLESKHIRVYLPRFKIESSIDMNEPLKKMGMKQMFTREADFSGISSSEPLRVSQVMQKAFIQVGENGTEAAAATGVVIMSRMFREVPPVVRVNQPFLFFVLHRTTPKHHVVLFSGRVVKPVSF